MTRWEWWVGYDEKGPPENYEIASCLSRAGAIHAGLRATKLGEKFWIVEARSSEDQRYEGADFVPFKRTRNLECHTNGPLP